MRPGCGVQDNMLGDLNHMLRSGHKALEVLADYGSASFLPAAAVGPTARLAVAQELEALVQAWRGRGRSRASG